MSMTVAEAASYKQLTASGLVRAGPGKLLGIFCSSSTAGTVKVWDNVEASGLVMVDTYTVVAGTFYPLPFVATEGLFVTIGGTASITVSADAP